MSEPTGAARARDALGRFAKTTITVSNAKVCVSCGVEKALSEFGPERRRSDGHKSRCRPCLAADQNVYLKARREEIMAVKRSPEKRAQRNAALRRKRREDREWRARLNAYNNRRYHLRWRRSMQELSDRYGAICHICRLPVGSLEEAEADHIIPVAHGGTGEEANIGLAHRICNRRKRDGLDWEHLRAA